MFMAKAYAMRLCPIAHKTIDLSQSAFIKVGVCTRGFSRFTRLPTS
jgi:hypothetical protein